MASATTLSVTDPEWILHQYQQLIAFGEHKGPVKLVATLKGDVCPSKAKIQIVFKKFDLLPDEIKRDLHGRFQVDFDEKFPGDPVYHLIPGPLGTRTGLSYEDENLSLSRTGEHEYHFPLVTNLEYDIKNLQSKDGLSEEERAFIDSIQEEAQARFPNAATKSESVSRPEHLSLWSRVWKIAVLVTAAFFAALAIAVIVYATLPFSAQLTTVSTLVFLGALPISFLVFKYFWDTKGCYTKKALASTSVEESVSSTKEADARARSARRRRRRRRKSSSAGQPERFFTSYNEDEVSTTRKVCKLAVAFIVLAAVAQPFFVKLYSQN